MKYKIILDDNEEIYESFKQFSVALTYKDRENIEVERIVETEDNFDEQQVLSIVKGVLTEIDLDIHQHQLDLKSEIEEETDYMNKAGMKKRRNGMMDAADHLRNIFTLTTPSFKTECCDAPGPNTFINPECSECGKKDPECYMVEPSLQNILGEVNWE